jgi:hypothetical protein
MNTTKKKSPELDIAGLVALRAYERPDPDRTEKNISNIMREVNSTQNVPTLLLFPEKGLQWMIAQPRYGIAALFILFLGLHLMDHPRPPELVAQSTLRAPSPAESIIANTNTVPRVNRMPALAKDPALYSPYSEDSKPLLTSFGE